MSIIIALRISFNAWRIKRLYIIIFIKEVRRKPKPNLLLARLKSERRKGWDILNAQDVILTT